MTLRNIYRPEGDATVAYSSGNVVEIELGRGAFLKDLALRLTGQPTVTDANNTAAKTKRGDEWGVITKLEVVANGGNVIRSYTGAELWWENLHWYKVHPQVTATLGDSATANPSFDSTLILPFWIPGSVRPMDTMLAAQQYDQLKLRVTWGAYTDINGDASAWTANPSLAVSRLESVPAASTLKFDPSKLGLWLNTRLQEVYTAANTSAKVRLPTGRVYRGFTLNTATSGTTDAAAKVTNIKLWNGSQLLLDVSETALHQGYILRSGRQRTVAKRGTTFNSETAWHRIDLCPDGYLTESLNSQGFGELYFELNVAATTYLTIIADELLMPA
jgi:hypothetical protein